MMACESHVLLGGRPLAPSPPPLQDDDEFSPPMRSTRISNLPSVDELMQVVLKKTPVRRRSALHDLISNVHQGLSGSSAVAATLEKRWREIQLRCQMNPKEAIVLDRRGRTCLHAVCAKRPPVAVVNALLKACGSDTILTLDKHGRTPLTIAITSNASLPVMGKLLEACPMAAKAHDHMGLLPLHLACHGHCPDGENDVELTRLLLQAYPEAACQETHNGRTALHCAIESGLGVELVRFLIRECPESVIADGCGESALFLAIRHKSPPAVVDVLIKAHPRATSMRDRNGGYPLQRAIESRAQWQIIGMLCRDNPGILLQQRIGGETALHRELMFGTPSEGMIRVLMDACPEAATVENNRRETPLDVACKRYTRLGGNHHHKATFWKSIQMLLKGARYGRLRDSDPIVPASAALSVNWGIMDLAIRDYPEQVAQRDPVTGEYPLHLALQSKLDVESKTRVVTKLLEVFSEAAELPTSNGRTVLSVAAESNNVSSQVLRKLVVANARALGVKDPQHGFYPFQVAALPRDAKRRRITYHPNPALRVDCMDTTAVFELLLAAPNLLEQYIK
uniref:Uncharacterized protein n=1 Tax=Grammatophora oceanica TaxID=210454 RepID=A0A7S1VTF7_9STRA